MRLSGPLLAFCSDHFSFQLKENRVALFCAVEHPDFGDVILINMHLHHGIELTKHLQERIDDLEAKTLLSQKNLDAIYLFSETAQNRRLGELKVLKENLDQIQSEMPRASVILGGDLNASDESVEYQTILGWGFKDCATQNKFPTWSSQKNQENHQLGRAFHFPWPLEDISENLKKQKILHDEFVNNEFRDRRIDFLFAKGEVAKALKGATPFADKPNPQGLVASDHFGVLAKFSD